MISGIGWQQQRPPVAQRASPVSTTNSGKASAAATKLLAAPSGEMSNIAMPPVSRLARRQAAQTPRMMSPDDTAI